MTEIPEHLLKRSQAAKAKAEGAEPPADSPAPTAATPAPVAAAPAAAAKAAAPAKPEAPKVQPDIPVVAAYKERKKIPVWAMVALSILPIWAFLYVKALTPEKAEAVGPMGAGQKIFTSICAGCHGASGEGGAGYPFANGEVGKTFPHIEDQLRYVYFGTAGYQAAGVDIYGNPDREGGAHVAGARGPMPTQGGTLTDAEILEAVCYERYGVGGLAQDATYETWCSETSEIHAALASGSSTLANLHETFKDIIPIGDTPVPGSPPSS